MIWVCMAAFGPGAWYQIEGRMDQHLYKKNLETYLQSTIHNYNLDHIEVVFQHDNDPKHTAKSVHFWLFSQAISAPSMANSISKFESNGNFLGPSQMVFKPSHSKAKRCSKIVGECL